MPVQLSCSDLSAAGCCFSACREGFVSARHAALIGGMCGVGCLIIGAMAAVYVMRQRVRQHRRLEKQQAEVRTAGQTFTHSALVWHFAHPTSQQYYGTINSLDSVAHLHEVVAMAVFGHAVAETVAAMALDVEEMCHCAVAVGVFCRMVGS